MSRSTQHITNASNGSTVSQMNICLICERDSGQYVVYSRPTIGSSTPFFPILESLSNSTSSQVNCCRLCSQSLIDQWNEYEVKQIPIKNRFYYLNNNKLMTNNKNDFNNSFNIKKQLEVNNSSNNTNIKNTSEEVLDLSLASTSSSTQFRPNVRNDSNINNNNSVKYWTPNRYPQICYICGEECLTLVNVLLRPMANCPYFPSLVSHPKPMGANPIDSNGRIGSCDSCHRFLLQQWEQFQRSNVPIPERHYSFRPIVSINTRQRINRYSCALCSIELSHAMQDVVISMFTMNDTNSSMKKLILSSAQEFIISSGNNLETGRVLTCINCFRDLIKNNDNQQQYVSNHYSQNEPKKKSMIEFNNTINSNTGSNSNNQEICALCNRVKTQLFLIDTNPSQISLERKSFFPFLKDLLKAHEIDSFGRVRVCNVCLSSLESQWDTFESALIPHTQRDYRLMSRRSPLHRTITPPPLKIQVSSPPPLQQSFISEPLLTTVTTQTHNTYCTTSSSIQYPNETETKISGPMDDILSALGGPLHTTSANCVVCGEYSMSGHTYQILSAPRVPPLLNHELGIYPFFPILKKLISHNNSNNSNTSINNCDERDDNRNNTGLVCTFCYHSLIGQWIAYNISPFIEDKDPIRRTYNCKEYICYICGVTTFRQRVRSITVKDFPFLLEHPRPAGALTICNGESVVTCLTCFESLTLQWRDYERMKVPIEMRKYNWIIVPPPNRDSSSNETPLPLVQNLNESLSPSSLTTNSSLLLGLGSHHKLPVLNASQISTTKSPSGVQRSMATVSPLYQVSAPPPPGTVAPIAVTHSNPGNCHNVLSNSALAATRTSSFAAALRKLAKQSIDPLICGDNGQQCSSLGLSVSHSSNASKNSNTSFQSPYQSSIVCPTVGPSPPIVTIAPIPAHQIDRSNDVRKSENHIFYDHRIHSDQSKDSLLFSHSQQRTSPIVQIRPSPSREHNESGQSSANNHTTQNSVPNRSSGFQPYRTAYEDSLRSNSSSSLTSATLPSHLMPFETLTYPYHPFLPHAPTISASSAPLSHHIPHPSASYRLEDHFYLDRFSLLRGSLHGGSALSHTSNGNASTLPFNLNRYSELLNSQHERIINDERQRLLNQSLSQSTYKSGVQNIDSPPLHLNIPTTNDRIIDNNSDHHLLNHLNHSVINSSAKRDYLLNSSSGSILSGTPRDHLHLSSSNSNRKPNAPPISASIKPLNLSSTSEHISSNSEQIYLWRPQSDEERERITSDTIQSHHQNEQIIDGINRKNNSLLIEDSLQSKGLRINSFENTNSLIENRSNDKVIATTKFLPSEKNEGLHSRILENTERGLVNDSSIYNNHWQPNMYRTELISNSPKSPPIRKEIEEQVISKLDLEELKLKQKRLNKSLENSISSEEEDDEEESEDNDEDNKYNIILTKRLPLKLDTNPDKMQFLRTFNLTTHKRKSQLEFNKYLKRRKLLRELSPEPSLDRIDSIEENKENPHIFVSSEILPDSIASQESNLEVKIHFMSTIGLREQISSEKQKTTELLWDGIIRDREMRSKRGKCWIKLLNNLNKETLHKWLSNLQTTHSHSSHEIDINSHLSSNGFIQNGFSNSKFSNNLHSSRGQRKVILFNKQLNSDSKSSLSVENRSHSHSQNSSKDFAQEFHESVLLETTKQQQKARHERHDRHDRYDHQIKSQEIQHKHYADLSSSSNYKWPGIEAVMEAYDRYSCDQKQEKDFLQERTHQLKNRLQDINREAEYLSQKMADLIQTKTQLDDERKQYESALDSLKKCLKQLR